MASYKELLAQRDTLDKQIESARNAELDGAIKQVKDLIKEYALTAADCGFVSKKANAGTGNGAGTSVKPKYITPDGQTTWTGRGNAPKPFKALFDAGQKKEDFLIK